MILLFTVTMIMLVCQKLKLIFFLILHPLASMLHVKRRDIERYKRYYSLLVRQFRELPCCHCCPISKNLVREIEDHIDETERNISLISDFIVTYENMLGSHEEETTV